MTNTSQDKTALPMRVLNYLLPLMCAAAVALYIGNICSYEIAVEVSINGAAEGYVESRDLIGDAKRRLESYIYEELGDTAELDCDITYSFALVKDPVYLTGEECEALLQAVVDRDYCNAYMLYVDDVEAAAYENYRGLNTLIDEIEDDLLESAGNSFNRVEISNRLRIEKQLCPRDALKSLDEINELLNPLAAEAEALSAAEAEPMRISAFASIAPRVLENSELIDPDVDYGLTRNAGDDGHDLTLSYTFIRTETVEEILHHETRYIDDYDNYVGTDTVLAEGSDGLRTVTYEISFDADGNEIGRVELSESIFYYPSERVVMVGAVEIPDAVPTGTFIWPCATPKGVSSPYGGRDLYGSYDFHLGIDIPGEDGTSIYASDGGEVIWAGFTPSYGNSIRIQHNDGYVTLYAHMEELLVAVGDMVFQGQEIGHMGHTGAAYGTHLHFEIRVGSLTVNPRKYLPKLNG